MLKSGFDKLIEKATSNLLMEPDWATILKICDMVRQNDVQPKTALAGVIKKLKAPNPHSAMYAVQLLESLVKNCGSSIHDELTTQAYCESLTEIVKTTQYDNVRQKMLELIQAWAYAFRNTPKFNHLKEMMNSLKAEGYKFPQMRESDAMFSADSAPVWADGEVCHRCRAQFSIILRKHHCRACGQVFCNQCSGKTSTLPKFGIEKEVRVCDACFDAVNKPSSAAAAINKDADLEEYLKSSLAQQSQLPPRKTDSEIQEEEEFQLALAISQSEAEAKEKEKLRVTSAYGNFKETLANRTPELPATEETNPELARYLQRSYWENRQSDLTNNDVSASPSAPSPASTSSEMKTKENGVVENEIEDFVKTLKSQVEIFINRMKSNSSRGRSITYDNSVQTLFMNITAMHSRLLKYIQEHDDSRLYFERLQDKLAQVKDARAALDALREEHQEKLRRQAEEAERQRQMLMAHKLDIMRKKKQEYLQYQRQVALQRIQEQEREMQMRQEQQKQQYIMGPQYFMGSPIHGQQFPPNSGFGYQFPNPQAMMGIPGQPQQTGPQSMGMPPNSMPGYQMAGMPHPNMQPPGQNMPHHMQQGQNMPHPNMQQGQTMHHPNMQSQLPPQQNMQGPPQSIPPSNQMMGNPNMMPPNPNMLPNQNAMPPNQIMQGQPNAPMNMQHSMQYQQPGAPPASPQIQPKEETQTAELISFD